MSRIYRETFDEGPGGWLGWNDNFRGPKALDRAPSAVISRSPWWIDYNHAPPGAGYLHMLFSLLTKGPGFGEAYMVAGGPNRFVEAGFPTDFTNARLTLRMRGELETRGANMALLIQGSQGGKSSGWILTGQPLTVTPEWTEQSIVAAPDPAQWTCIGSRHDRTLTYGYIDLATILGDVNANMILVLFPLDVVPMGPLDGDPHRLRPEVDYPVWRSRLPEGYIVLDEVRIEFP
jgi:hypothetical protein